MTDDKTIHQKEGKYVVINTKTSPHFAEIFNRICRKKGIRHYQAIQMMIDSFVRYTDDRHNLSEEMERLMFIFEHMDGWKDAFNLADASADRQIDEAIYFMTADGKKGTRAVMVHRPYFGNWTETVNVQQILERVIEVLMPERYRRLRALAVDKECNSILELLDHMIEYHTVEQENADLRREFEDCNRHDYGKPVEYGQRTKRKHHKGVEMYDKQQTIRFSPEDVPPLPELCDNCQHCNDDNPYGLQYCDITGSITNNNICNQYTKK